MKLSSDVLQWMDRQVNRCSKCGSCRDVCPVFGEEPVESYAPRARAQLVKHWLDGGIKISRRFREIMDFCLACRSCSANCPNGVEVHKLVLYARRVIREERGSNLPVKAALSAIKSPAGQIVTQKGIKTYTRYIRKPVNLMGFTGYPAKNLEILPPVKENSFRESLPQVIGEKGSMRVGYFTGCMTQVFYPGIGRAVVDALQSAGCQVVIPRRQVCCGFPSLIHGDKDEAERLAAKNIRLFMKNNLDAVVTDCASCGEALKNYAGDFPEIIDARHFSSIVQDISYFLVHNALWKPGPVRLDVTVTYHDPCHLNRGQNIHREPRELIQRVPGIKLVEMDNPGRCCGGAGTFNFTHHEMSMSVGRHKLKDIESTGADIVATGCPACRTQLNYLLNGTKKILHPLEIIKKV